MFRDTRVVVKEGVLAHHCFHNGTDYTLSILKLVRLSLNTDAVVVVERVPYPTKTDLGTHSRIVQYKTLLPLGSGINRVPL